jgi:hypothetical protein
VAQLEGNVSKQFSFQTAPFNVGGERQGAGRHGRWFRHGDQIIVLLDSAPLWDEGIREEDYLPAGEWENFVEGEPASAPVFHFEFPPPAGCPALTEAEFNGIVRQAVIEAIRLANNAADKLEVVTPETARLYRFFFCHDPSRPVPWAGNEASGSIVAKRFRAVAKELGGGRRIVFRCDPNCPGDIRGFTNVHGQPNVIGLCAPFWNPPLQAGLPPEGFRAGVILHEMFHLLLTMRHDQNEKRTNNAHCLRAFALRALGYGQDNLRIGACTGDPC